LRRHARSAPRGLRHRGVPRRPAPGLPHAGDRAPAEISRALASGAAAWLSGALEPRVPRLDLELSCASPRQRAEASRGAGGRPAGRGAANGGSDRSLCGRSAVATRLTVLETCRYIAPALEPERK